ncbi:MAG: response regulator transcription factor [Lachnospiraceae bacterium]|nr:response regulator transcription factor [Lachnospiraceae bacterium]
MIKIAICDDSPEELQTLTNHLNMYKELKPTPLHLYSFQNGFSLLDAIEHGEQFDIAILDILMPGENGIDIARDIRKRQPDMEIIFLTSTPEYALESYEVKARNYLLKPVSKNKLFAAIDYVLDQLNKNEDSGFIVYNSAKQYTRILFSQLVYGEAMLKTVNLYMANNTMISSVMTFTELLKLLNGCPDFIHPHRSYVVNMNFIQYVDKNEICLINGKKIPLSRNNYAKISKQFLDFACSISFEQ